MIHPPLARLRQQRQRTQPPQPFLGARRLRRQHRAVAADPITSDVYQITTRYSGPAACKGCPFPVLVFRRSSDGGATYGADQFLYVTKNPQNDPQIQVAANGTLYVAWLDNFNPGVKFIKSSDHGATWTVPISFTGKGRKPSWSDKPWLAISKDGSNVYIAFNASDSYVVSSHDGGNTFSDPVKTNNDTRYWFANGGAVAANGTVYFSEVDFSQTYVGPANIDVLKSIDGGASFATTRVDVSQQMPDCPWAAGCTLGFFGSSAALARASVSRPAASSHPAGRSIRTASTSARWDRAATGVG